jgi:hypothetical protein
LSDAGYGYYSSYAVESVPYTVGYYPTYTTAYPAYAYPAPTAYYAPAGYYRW